MAATNNIPLHHVRGEQSEYPQDAVEIFEGVLLGDNAGYARGLVAGDPFIGHSQEYYDNSEGDQGDHSILRLEGRYRLQVPLSGVTATDVGRPVYAGADDTLTLLAPGNSFVGVVRRYVTTDTAVVEFRAGEVDEFGSNAARETKSADYTVDAEDSGKILYVDTDAQTITLPATVAGLEITIVNAGAFGTVGVPISPGADDKIMGNDITAADNKDLVNTKATAQRGDFVTLVGDGADGWFIKAMRGTWAREA